ncbi:Uncharacterised protein [Pseudomonas fluorescens]|uniref:Uncharacterized protein n=1 Tax=Pseudomonas fluorescens TaxID=294 RepID=A0A448DUT1_PSEFL|nr:hypothetical protein [Pseudomonas fluorescens]VEF10583.1 Uncharacterised protein [Pseudomonas fluorescens]
MDFQPLQIKEAVNGVIKLQAVDNGGTAVIAEWDVVHEDDQVLVMINGKVAGDLYLVGRDPQFPLELPLSKSVFLDHSGQGKVEFIYSVFLGSDFGNEYRSLPVSYSIELVR